MDDLEFRQRALADPRDDDPAFLAAAGQSEARGRFLDSVLRLEQRLESMLLVDAPSALRDRLLELDVHDHEETPATSPRAHGLLARLLPIAACLVIAWGAALDVWRPRVDPALEHEIFTHIYRELSYLGIDNDVTLEAVNRYMAVLEGRLLPGEGPDSIEIKVADDCWVAASDTVHLVLEGERGPVTVLLVRNTPVDREFPIFDRRFSGLVTPTRGGNLVLVGEKQERLGRYKRHLSERLDWEY